MIIYNARDFRAGMAGALDRAWAGETVVVSRRGQHFAITPMTDDDLEPSETFKAKVKEAWEQYRRGETLHFDNHEEMKRWLGSL